MTCDIESCGQTPSSTSARSRLSAGRKLGRLEKLGTPLTGLGVGLRRRLAVPDGMSAAVGRRSFR